MKKTFVKSLILLLSGATAPTFAETLKGYPQQVGSAINAQYILKVNDKEGHNICKLGEALRSIPSGTLVNVDGDWTQPINRLKKKLPKCFAVNKLSVEKMPSGRKPLSGKVNKTGEVAKLVLKDGTSLNLAKIPDGMITKLDQPLLVDTDPAYDAANKDAAKQMYRITVWIEEPNDKEKPTK